jgi:two-component system NtrC family sensor kinase
MLLILFREIPAILILAGTLVMLLSIQKTRELLRLFDYNQIPRNWKILYLLMILFLGGYSVAIWLTWHQKTDFIILLTGVVFLGGAFFVLFSVTTCHQTLSQLIASQKQLHAAKSRAEDSLARLQQVPSLIQTEKMAGLGQMVAGVAHEINNPVNFIYGNVSPAKDYVNDLIHLVALYETALPTKPPNIQKFSDEIDFAFIKEDLPKLLDSIEHGAQRIAGIVCGLKTFSRMDESQFKEVDLHQGLDSTLVILEHRLKANPKRSTIEVTRCYGGLPNILCYAGELNQVFMNLLANAIDALDEAVSSQGLSHPKIKISTSVYQEVVRISIVDNGTGIPPTLQNRLFDPFFTTKPVGQGTGLGLSISYQIVTKKHGGDLRCYSQPGFTEFVIELPIRSQTSQFKSSNRVHCQS